MGLAGRVVIKALTAAAAAGMRWTRSPSPAGFKGLCPSSSHRYYGADTSPTCFPDGVGTGLVQGHVPGKQWRCGWNPSRLSCGWYPSRLSCSPHLASALDRLLEGPCVLSQESCELQYTAIVGMQYQTGVRVQSHIL